MGTRYVTLDGESFYDDSETDSSSSGDEASLSTEFPLDEISDNSSHPGDPWTRDRVVITLDDGTTCYWAEAMYRDSPREYQASMSWKKYFDHIYGKDFTNLGNVSDLVFRGFLEYNNKSKYPHGKHKYLNWSNQRLGSNKLRMYVDYFLKNKWKLNYLCLDNCCLRSDGISALCDLMKQNAEHFERLDCAVLPLQRKEKLFKRAMGLDANYAGNEHFEKMLYTNILSEKYYRLDYSNPETLGAPLSSFAYPEHWIDYLRNLHKKGTNIVAKTKATKEFEVNVIPEIIASTRKTPWHTFEILKHNNNWTQLDAGGSAECKRKRNVLSLSEQWAS